MAVINRSLADSQQKREYSAQYAALVPLTPRAILLPMVKYMQTARKA